MKRKLIAVETHPIQYKVPLFRLLAREPSLEFKVLYAMLPDAHQQGAGFGVSFEWDVPLMEGYAYEVLENRSPHPAVNVFGGCDTPGIHAVLRRERPDAVLINGWVVKSCLQALRACRRLAIPALVRGEATLLRPRARWKHAAHRLLLAQYQAYLAIGSANREFYRFHHCREDRIFWAPYAVDNRYCSEQARERAGRRAALRESFGIPPDAVVFLFAGKLDRKKHPLDMLQALARIPGADRNRAHALLVGDGPLRAECEAWARSRDLPVTFAGFLNQSRMPDAYATSDVLVLPSDAGETWGLVVNEAMASGRPALVSRAVGCCADLIVEGKTGHAFDLHDLPGLADGMAGYVRDAGRARRQGESAQRHVQSFCQRAVMDGILQAAGRVVESEIQQANRIC